jgi:hypothetical protein
VNETVWCVEVCDFEACWYHRIYDNKETAQAHVDSYELTGHEQQVSLVERTISKELII